MDVSGLGHRNAEAIALDGYLATGDRITICENPEFIRFLGVQRNHCPPAHAQQLLHGHVAAAQNHRKLNLYVMHLGFLRHATTPSDSALVEPERVSQR